MPRNQGAASLRDARPSVGSTETQRLESCGHSLASRSLRLRFATQGLSAVDLKSAPRAIHCESTRFYSTPTSLDNLSPLPWNWRGSADQTRRTSAQPSSAQVNLA